MRDFRDMAPPKTDFETIKVLAVFTTNVLKENNIIDFDLANRERLVEAMATEYGVSFATDEDIKEQAIEEVEEKMGRDNIPEDILESEMYNHARKEIIKSFNGESIGGLYLVESLHKAAQRMTRFLLRNDLVDDVYGTDEEIQDFIVSKVRTFTPPVPVAVE